jgi:hypothetical protein
MIGFSPPPSRRRRPASCCTWVFLAHSLISSPPLSPPYPTRFPRLVTAGVGAIVHSSNQQPIFVRLVTARLLKCMRVRHASSFVTLTLRASCHGVSASLPELWSLPFSCFRTA